MQHTMTHNLHEHPDLKGSDPIIVTFSKEGTLAEVHTLPAGFALAAAALASRKPHPLALLQLRRVVADGRSSYSFDTAPDTQLARHAQAVLEGRWRGTPWRWDLDQAAQLFAFLQVVVGDLRGQARTDAHTLLNDNADFVARAFMAPPDAELELMPHGPTAHEAALMLAIHCTVTIAKAMAANGLSAEGGISSWAECVETLDAAVALVKQAAMPTTSCWQMNRTSLCAMP